MDFKFKDVPAWSVQAKKITKKSKVAFETYRTPTEETIFRQDIKPYGKKKIKRLEDRYNGKSYWTICEIYFPSESVRDIFIWEKTQGYITMIRTVCK